MNIYLLQLVGKWLNLLVVSVASFFGSVVINNEYLSTENINKNKNTSVINNVVEFNTIYNYSYKLPLNTTKIINKGKDGVVNKDSEGNVVQVLKEMVTEVVEIGRGPSGNFVGRMTGYGADCYGCSKVGNVACKTKSGNKHSLINDGEYYQDDEYGSIRILSATHSVFPCGTIIKVNHAEFGEFYGVVLDTGGAMISAWNNKEEILIDLAFKTENDKEVFKATANNVKYEVQRWGW